VLREEISLREILDEVTRHDLRVEQKNWPVEHALPIQLRLLYSSEFLERCLPQFQPSILYSSSEILYASSSINYTYSNKAMLNSQFGKEETFAV
jgi:hypothetical protein